MFQNARAYLPSTEALTVQWRQNFETSKVAALEQATAVRINLQARSAELQVKAGQAHAQAQRQIGEAHAEAQVRLSKAQAVAQTQLGQAQANVAASLRHVKPDTSTRALIGTTFNLLNATTGPGLLALPLAFSRCGWLAGTVLLLLVFALNNASLLILLRACLATREHSYIGLSLRTGPSVAALVDWASLVFFFGSCISYLVIIGDTFNFIGARLCGDANAACRGGESMHFSLVALGSLLAFTALCLAPLSMLRSMDSLQITSGIATICIIYFVLVVALTPAPSADAAPAAAAAAVPPSAVAIDLSAATVLSLPTMTFCFSSQSLFPPALESLHQPATYEYMHRVVALTMYLTLGLHLLVGLGGYGRWGGAVTANILDVLPQTGAVLLARVAIVLAFAFTYPMMIFLCRMHIQSILARSAVVAQQTDQPGPAAPREEQHRLVSTLLVACSLLAAILFPDIDALFGLLGGTTAVVISFVAPALFWDQFVGFMYKWSHPSRLFTKSLIGFSVAIAALSLPGVMIGTLGDLYSTAWWVPMASSTGLQTWSGGLANGEFAARPLGAGSLDETQGQSVFGEASPRGEASSPDHDGHDRPHKDGERKDGERKGDRAGGARSEDASEEEDRGSSSAKGGGGGGNKGGGKGSSKDSSKDTNTTAGKGPDRSSSSGGSRSAPPNKQKPARARVR